VVEFVTVGVLLLVPLVYLVVATSRIQAASFAADSAARAAARSFVTAPDDDEARRRAEIAVDLGLRDQGFDDPRDRDVTLTCGDRTTCLTPGGQVDIEVEVRVVLPGVPRSLGRALSTDVTVHAEQIAVVDEFRVVGDDVTAAPERGPA
jgi:hypothetical protein